ncbi:S8 family serine peptidase [Solirubrobacter sp. CPCC 204708]|uniref:S8 family serine peptidase n=1 Tax=Solirubrobacter deserti TaxID=2282478 RepID=A0ABT4RF14_9ACTN|nr:S8 family serine peptidase [Solirubrobacter deserti]MBE2318669.1 S8 family serine peptidase [Solirubrobacter deserti]MDA0137127.1 S8 family serine peptidase [Solirubrobacter deserti]
MPLRSRLPLLAFSAIFAGAVAAPAAWAGGASSGDARAASAALKARAQEPAQYRVGEVVVRDRSGARVVRVKDVARGARSLSRRPGVRSATPNYVARLSGWIPPDPGPRGGEIGGWQKLQWNFLPATGVDAPNAWANLARVGRPGGKGVVVAVLDTGVAYANRGPFHRSPDFSPHRFVKGWDFVEDDPYPNDDNGHGTHVASTIAEGTGNSIGLTGLAYGVKVMPVKVLDSEGEGDSQQIARGIRFAAKNGAHVINLSFEFPSEITRSQIPNILDAISYARRQGTLVVGASGNAAAAAVAYPARSRDVLSVGATTQHGCQADYSNEGADLDLVAPGGGVDAALEGDPNCVAARPGMDIFQMTFRASAPGRFTIPSEYIGTSMAAPHAAATAALVIASGILGPDPTPAAIERRLETTAVDLGPPGLDPHYGAGRLNAARATDPAIPVT